MGHRPGEGTAPRWLFLLRALSLVRLGAVLALGAVLGLLAVLGLGAVLGLLAVLSGGVACVRMVGPGRVRLTGALVLVEAVSVRCASARRPEHEELVPVQADLRDAGRGGEDDQHRGGDR